MKIEKFLLWLQDKLLNYPDIHLRTLKMFIDKFDTCLSDKEKEREKISIMIQLLKELSSKQISIDTFVHNEKTKHLETQLNNLKGKQNESNL